MNGSSSIETVREPKRWLGVLAWSLLVVALHQVFVLLSTTLSGRDVELWFFFSSDTVQYGLLYKDLFDLGFHYGGWNISHAPEYLQMLWSLAIRALSPTLAAGHVREALAQPVLLTLALHFLLRRVLGRTTILAPVIVAAALILIARGIGLDFIAIVWSNRHGFTALLAVLALALTIDLVLSRRRSIALIALVSIGVASDLLFLVWFVAPVAVALVAFSGGERRAWALRTVGAISTGVGLGLLIFWLATPLITVGDKLTIDLGSALGALGRMADDARLPSLQQRLLNFILASGFVISAIASRRAHRAEERMVALYALLLPVFTIAAMALTSAPFRESGYSRYLLAPEIAGLAALVLLVERVAGRFGEAGVLAAVVVAIVPGFALRAEGVTPVDRYYPPLVRCIDEAARKHGLQYGVADYWMAKYVTALSATDLSVVAVTPRLDPYVPFSNIEWFLGGVGARRHDRPAYTFAIVGPTSATEPGPAPQAIAALGEPVAIVPCFTFRVVVLPRGSDERIRAQFAQNRKIREYYGKRGYPLPVSANAPPADSK